MKDINKTSFNNSAANYDITGLMRGEEEIITAYFKGKKVLDVGCGVGRTTTWLHNKGYAVIGIDYAPKLIVAAKKKYPDIKFLVMDAKKLSFKNASFDTVFFSYNGLDYLHPLKNRRNAMKEAYRVLKKDGVFIFSTHKRFYWRIPIKTKYPFIRIHYLRSMKASLLTKGNYRVEKHPFGKLKTYCKNDCTQEGYDAGFKKVKRIDNGMNAYYICTK